VAVVRTAMSSVEVDTGAVTLSPTSARGVTEVEDVGNEAAAGVLS